MEPFATEAEKQERREMIAYLRATPPAELSGSAEQATVAAFHRAIREVPAYRRLFSAHTNAAPADITDLAAFRQAAPLLDKHNTFGAFDVRELSLGGTLDGVRSFLTSSGHSGVFSFGVNTAENLARSSRSIDTGLEYVFGVDERSTLLINALPMGVKVNTKATVLAETSVRDDMVYALVKKFAADFDQIIIVAEGSFAKKILEDGAEHHGIDWAGLPVSLITGEEGIAENYRDYVAGLIGVPDPGHAGGKLIMSSMGVAELDLNIFHETADTIAIRRLAHRDPALRKALFGDDATVCPMLFVYYPHRCYVEEVKGDGAQPELVLSMLSEEMKIPLLRYRSGDLGRIFTYDRMVEILAAHGYRVAPDLKLPFVAVYGRGSGVSAAAGRLTPEEVKEAIYADHALAATLTGNFRITVGAESGIDIAFQLRKGKQAVAGAADRFAACLAAITPVSATARFIPYAEFPYMMEVDWERKFRYV